MNSEGREHAASVYERAVGPGIRSLPPVLRRYFGPVPEGHVGVGEGVYSIVGSRYRRTAGALLRWSARHDVLFPESGRDIPFVVENRAAADGTLRGTRWFGFPRTTRVMRDTMHVDGGEIVQRLGRRGGLEVRLAARASAEGMLLRSRRLAWWIRGLRVPLPRIAGVEVRETEDGNGRQRVDVRLRMPLLGEVFRYSGTFVYRIRPERGTVPAVSPALPTLSMWLTQNSPN
ncbi:DUF4166 domain-containing protein [Microbacterium sp. KSW4-11]|uniref:DUF4166 domain-containing protein n=1 Tax=Microbacterium gawkjiense TaxID=3067309 RepID=A0ABU3GBP0_9MICO|nr:DUF4166 domain-containing protein [Microbacterium sp. KSW4-11]MDT3317232.1 DUF4166 domain-containing protein [Microbacterium sp. KSW4-11]